MGISNQFRLSAIGTYDGVSMIVTDLVSQPSRRSDSSLHGLRRTKHLVGSRRRQEGAVILFSWSHNALINFKA